MTTQMKSLLFVAAIAILPVACGTNSPMGTDLAGLEAGASVSALRVAPPVPPQAPEELPSNTDPSAQPSPAPPNAPPTTVPNAQRPNRPVTEPSLVPFPMPGVPNTEGPVVVPPPSNVPPTTVPNSGPSPAPNGNTTSEQDPAETDPVPGESLPNVPVPSEPGPDPVDLCAPVSIEITQVGRGQGSNGIVFMATLSYDKGSFDADPSCEKLTWAAVGNGATNRLPVITYDDSSRIVTITGMSGLYKISATAPNAVSGVIVVDVQ